MSTFTERLNLAIPQNRITAVLFLAQSFFSASTIAAFTLSPIIAYDLSGSEAASGLPQTFTLAGRAAFAYPLGLLMDSLGRRIALGLGYSMAVIGSIVAIFAIMTNSFILFLLGSLLIGMARASGDQSCYVAAEVFPLAERAKIIGFIVFAGTVGAIVGPRVIDPSTILAEQLGLNSYTGPFAFAGIGSFVLLFLIKMTIGLRVEAEQEMTGLDISQHGEEGYTLG